MEVSHSWLRYLKYFLSSYLDIHSIISPQAIFSFSSAALKEPDTDKTTIMGRIDAWILVYQGVYWREGIYGLIISGL